ncbi:putative glutathione peroxidase 8 isoform 2-T2 [Clarias gariepinus]|uniref:probable glutathione peroxidase 8 isoform X2 n=1 Tax=Clarias gariepinus TaxID=13013 RepID=UPI00234C74C7|nr:probable glutathione peroxidase 8 isoform X2 [Clarias gariepinus]
MEALGGYPSKSSSSRPRLVSLVLTVSLCISSLFLLHAQISRSRSHADFYSFQVKDTKGRGVSLEKYRGKYGETEPGTGRDAEAFARSNYAVTFPFFNLIKIMGSEAEPAFRFLTDSVQQMPKWNFWKFLVGAEGQVLRVWKPEEPMEEIRREATALVREIILKKRHEL